MSISTIIITKNEAKNIETCIRSVEAFSDEIIIVDSFSTDLTKEIACRSPKVKFYERKFDNYISQKNFANALALSDYIFSIDADEYCSEDMIAYLKDKPSFEKNIISFLRINKIGDKEIKNGIWKNDIKERLWLNKTATWAGTTPHEHLEYFKETNVLRSHHILYHNAYESIDQYYQKSMNYAALAAERYVSRSYLSLFFSMVLNPMFKFVKGYVVKSGFLDGRLGIEIAVISYLETLAKYRKAINLKWKKS